MNLNPIRQAELSPFLKWVGGKRQLLPEIVELLPKNIRQLKYTEPFVGGGALLFHLQMENAVINDLNKELMNVYQVIKDNPGELIEDLRKHRNDITYFYEIRQLDRTDEFEQLSAIERASRIIFLNRTCFNGLYRVNKSGQFNAPFGYYINPDIINESKIKAVHHYLTTNNVTIKSGDYSKIMDEADGDSFFYLDPPYHPIAQTSNFTGYTQGGWDAESQINLKLACDELDKRGIRFLLSNSSSGFIRELYKDYETQTVKANRAVNSNGNGRGKVDEFLIRNYYG